MRRLTTLTVASFVALAVAAPAQAARLVTWTTTSRHVDPQKATDDQYNRPPGVSPRPRALRANVLLPDGYDGKRRFPILYLLHGQGDAYDSWVNPQRGDVLRVARGFPGIILMPEADRGFYTNWWNGGRRGDPAWERYHLDELIPLAERRLRIQPGRSSHAIAGLSMGGEGAVFYATQRPGYFGSVASFSGPLSIERDTYQSGFDAGTGQKHEEIYGDPSAQGFYWAGHNPTKLVANLRSTRTYVTAGDGTPANADEAQNYFGSVAEAELGQQAKEFADAASAAGVPLTYVPRQGIHDWQYWRRHLADAIEWGFFEPVQEAPTSWEYATVAQTGEAWGFRFRFAKPPESLENFALSGVRQLAAAGSGTVTLDTPDGCSITRALPFEGSLPVDEDAPLSVIARGRSRLRRGRLTVRGKARDKGCGGERAPERVELAVSKREGNGKCRVLGRRGRLGRRKSCRRPLFLPTRGTTSWRFRRRARLPRGGYLFRSRAIDRAGNVEGRRSGRARNRLAVRIR